MKRNDEKSREDLLFLYAKNPSPADRKMKYYAQNGQNIMMKSFGVSHKIFFKKLCKSDIKLIDKSAFRCYYLKVASPVYGIALSVCGKNLKLPQKNPDHN